MPDVLAKGSAAIVAGLLVLVVGFLIISSRPPAGTHQVNAEFDNAFPIIEGMHVRVDGAIAGSVGPIEVNDRGNAELTLLVDDSIDPATIMGDASAAIRQQDTTGDSYVALDPGGYEDDSRSSAPLGDEGIVCETDGEGRERCPDTMVAPRLDDLANAFGPPERAGVQLLLVELSKALDRRGVSLNKAALELKPAFEAANRALEEVNQQNEALKSLIVSAEAVTGQAAERDAELGRLIDSLATTVETTAGESEALDAGLAKLPETARQARTILAALGRAATNATPLANDLASAAPGLATAVERLPAFLDDAEATLNRSEPTLELTRRLLRAARPALEVGKERLVTGAFDLTGATADLLNAVLGGEDAFPALFDDDSYGEGPGTLGRRGFGAVATEPGNLPGYPADHADRGWLRVSAVVTCEMFGVEPGPGCLTDVIGGLLPTAARGEQEQEQAAKRRKPAAQPEPDPELDQAKPLPGLLELLDPIAQLPDLPELDDAVGELGLGGLTGKREKAKPGKAKRRPARPERGLSDLLDFLMR